MNKKTIPTEKFKQLAEKNLTKERIQELTLTVIGPSATVDLATLSANEIQLLILEQKYLIQKLQLLKSPLTDTIAKNDENNGVVVRLKQTAQRALQLLRLATGTTISIIFIIPLVLVIVVPTLVLSLTFAVVCFPIFLLSTPFIWFFASKNKKSTKQKISDTLENAAALLCTLQEASNNKNDRNEKIISQENSNDNNTYAPVSPIKNYSLFFDEKKSQLPNSIQDQHASAFISKSP